MSDYHILLGNRDGNSFSIVMHFPIPNAVNDVGVNYRTAAVEYQRDLETGEMPKSRVPFIMSAEQIQLDGGELVEVSVTFATHPGENLAQKRTRLDDLYSSMRSGNQAEWANRLSYWGYNRDIPV